MLNFSGFLLLNDIRIQGKFSHRMRTMSVAMKYDVNALALSFGASYLPLGSSLNSCCIDWWCHWSFLLLSHKLASAIAVDSQLCHLLWSKGHCCLRSSEPDLGFYQDHWSSQHLFPWRGHEGLLCGEPAVPYQDHLPRTSPDSSLHRISSSSPCWMFLVSPCILRMCPQTVWSFCFLPITCDLGQSPERPR